MTDRLKEIMQFSCGEPDPLFTDGKQICPKFEEPFAELAGRKIAERIHREDFLPGALAAPLREYCQHMAGLLRDILSFPIKELTPEEWDALFEEYPVAFRLCRQHSKDFICAVSAAADGLHRHFSDLSRLGISEGHGRIRRFTGTNAGNLNGKSVWVIEFESGEKAVAKPTDGGTDRLLSGLCSVVTEAVGIPPFRFPGCLEDEGGSFFSFVSPEPVQCEEDFALYFRRCGILSGVLYFLGGRDFQQENVIAQGSFPVMIDTELTATEFLQEDLTILDSGLFPHLNFGCAILPGGCLLGSQHAGWNCLPYDETGARNGREYLSEIEKGFREACRVLTDFRENPSALRDLRDCFGCRIRTLTREVGYYGKYLTLAFRKEPLKSEATFEVRLTKLEDYYREISQPEKLKRLGLAAERESLLNGYEPRILLNYPAEGENALWEAFLTRLNSFTDDTESEQIALIRADLAPESGWKFPMLPGMETASAEQKILQAVDGVFGYLEALPSYGKDFCLIAPTENGGFIPVGDSICHSEMGMGLLPAALLRADACKSAGDIAERILRRLKQEEDPVLKSLRLNGLLNGEAGTLLLCNLLHRMGKPQPEVSRRILEKLRFSPMRPNPFPILSVAEGTAGSLLSLVTLPEEQITPEITERIRYCIAQLYENRSDGIFQKEGTLYGRFGCGHALALAREFLLPEEEEYFSALCAEEMPETVCSEETVFRLHWQIDRGEDVRAMALSLAESLLNRLNAGNTPLGEPEGFAHPGFFRGIGGVLYVLLRAVHPELPFIF